MKITFDPAKNARNIKERGLSFERVAEVNFATALTWVDNRRNYGEQRFCSLAWMSNRLHAVTYTIRVGEMRVISFRKANAKERRKYETQKTRS